MAILFFDTETTGLPDKHSDLSDEKQPHIIQLAAILFSENLIPILQLNALVKPDGWEVSEFVQNLTGISLKRLKKEGISETSALALFLDMYRKARLVVAHNIYFDNQIIQIASARYALAFPEKEMFCTMESSKNILQLPPTPKMVKAGFDCYKNPSLTECVKFFFGEEFDGAHNALNDVNACLRVYRAIQDLSIKQDN